MSNNSLMKRIMALLLVIVLCIGLLPANALAEGLAGDADAAEVTTSVQTDAEAADASEPAEPADSQAEEAASEEAYPAQEFEATIEETGLTVKVEAPEGALPENTELVLSDVDGQAAKDAAAEAVADAVPEQAETSAPEPKAEQAEKPAAPAKPEAPAADQLDPEALRLDIIKRVKAFCLADMANNKPKVGALFARFGLNRVSAIEAADAFEIDAALKDELGI